MTAGNIWLIFIFLTLTYEVIILCEYIAQKNKKGIKVTTDSVKVTQCVIFFTIIYKFFS